MGIEFEDVSENFRKIVISGRLDIQGTGEIETKFAALSASAARRVVVDLRQVSFLASIGIRALISNAKALQHRGGRMVLLIEADSAVAKTLEMTGMDALLPTFVDPAEADQSALA